MFSGLVMTDEDGYGRDPLADRGGVDYNAQVNPSNPAMALIRGNPNETKDFARWSQDNVESVELYEHFLRGDRLLVKQGFRVWEAEEGNRLVTSEKGIREICANLYMALSRNVPNANLTRDEVNVWVLVMGESLRRSLGVRLNELGITPAAFPNILMNYRLTIKTQLSRSIEAGERDAIWSSPSGPYNGYGSNPSVQPKKVAGFFDGLNPFR